MNHKILKGAGIPGILLAILLLTGCPWNSDTFSLGSTTFAEVSQPYRNKYGRPEDIYEFTSSGYLAVDWWWWSKGFSVTFVDTIYDNHRGWQVENEYSFPPVRAGADD